MNELTEYIQNGSSAVKIKKENFYQLKKNIFFRAEKQLSVFNVVKFPNDPCGAANGYNGTCFTNTECISRGGSSSGIVIWTVDIF